MGNLGLGKFALQRREQKLFLPIPTKNKIDRCITHTTYTIK